MKFPSDTPTRPGKLMALKERLDKLGINLAEVEEQATCGGGPGGQHLNKAAVVVILRYPKEGIVIRSQHGRSRALNRFQALRSLAEAVEVKKSREAAAARTANPPSEIPSQIRQMRIRKQKNRRNRRRKALWGLDEFDAGQ